MLAKPPGKGMQHLYDLIVETNEMVGWNINSITAFVLSQIYPLRFDEKVIEQSILNFSDRKYHHISVSDRVQIHYITKGSGLTAHMNISRDEVKLILPFSDAIVDAVVTRKDEVRRLLNLRREFVDIPDVIEAGDFVDIRRFKRVQTNVSDNTTAFVINNLMLSLKNISWVTLDTNGKFNPDGRGFIRTSVSRPYNQFVTRNYDVLLELFTKILDWYPKAYSQQLRIKNAIWKIGKMIEIEERLLE